MGCRIYVGHPKNANPFIQLYLPAGFRCGKKKSRAVSFNPEGGGRSHDQALACVTSWAWQWWNGLPEADQCRLLEAAGDEPDAKRQRT